VTKGDNLTQHIVHCECPADAVAYMIKRQAYHTDGHDVGFKYSFACSPQTVSYQNQSELRCAGDDEDHDELLNVKLIWTIIIMHSETPLPKKGAMPIILSEAEVKYY